jgi:hypothetical protein
MRFASPSEEEVAIAVGEQFSKKEAWTLHWIGGRT